MFNRKCLADAQALCKEQQQLIGELLVVCSQAGVPLPPAVPNSRLFTEWGGPVNPHRACDYTHVWEALRQHKLKLQVEEAVRNTIGA